MKNNKFDLQVIESLFKQDFLFYFESHIESVSRSEDCNQTSVLYSITLWGAKDPNPAWHPASISRLLSVTFRCIKILVLVDLGSEAAVSNSHYQMNMIRNYNPSKSYNKNEWTGEEKIKKVKGIRRLSDDNGCDLWMSVQKTM